MVVKMTRVFVDTTAFIDYLRSGKGDLPELLKAIASSEVRLYCSVITLIELYTGQSSVNEGKDIEKALDSFLVVSLDGGLARKVGEIRRKTHGVPLGDLIIGASAVLLDAQLATSNQKHFSKIPGLRFWKGKNNSNKPTKVRRE